MKKALLVLPVLLAVFVQVPVSAANDTISCSDYSGREKAACNNGKNISNAFDTNYCQRYSSVTQIEACTNGQYIGTYNYDIYCSQFGANYSACVMPTATSAPSPNRGNSSGVIAPKGASSFEGCSATNLEFSENCSQIQIVLKAINFALPLVCILCIAGAVLGVRMRRVSIDWSQQQQGLRLIWVVVSILAAYALITIALNIIIPGGAFSDV